MKLTRQIKARSVLKPAKRPFFVYDEAHLLGPSNSGLVSMMQSQRRPGVRLLIASQAVIKANSGKRVRFIGSSRWEDGSPVKSAPKKFVPAQVACQQIK